MKGLVCYLGEMALMVLFGVGVSIDAIFSDLLSLDILMELPRVTSTTIHYLPVSLTHI